MNSKTAIYILLVILLALLGCSEKKEKSEIIAKVGTSELTVNDLMDMIPNFDSLRLSKDQMENFVKRWVEREVIYQEVIRTGFNKQSDVQKALRKMSKDFLVTYYIDHFINENINISESEILSYYNENQDEFQCFEDEYHVKIILVASYNEALEIRRQIKGSDDFSQWARRRSLDGSRLNGGDLGFVTRAKISPILARIVAGMKEGTLSRPIKSEIGYNLIFLEEFRAKGAIIPLDEVKGIIKERLVAAKREENYYQFLNNLFEKADVKTNVDVLVSSISNTNQ